MRRLAVVLSVLATPACEGAGGSAESRAGGHVPFTREELLKPETCAGCHPKHYREWASSMHAYSATDPIFLAMNRRGQRETNQALGEFCVKCHAPMAVAEGQTVDGLNLDQLPSHLHGVTCYFCHNAVDVRGANNNMLTLANDTTMRGGIRDPVQPRAHRAEYSEYFDRDSPKSSAMCGGCHDIVTPNGVHLERTFREYEESIFSKPGGSFDTCQGCHMDGRKGIVAQDPSVRVPLRTVHEHLWPGVDVALTEFPDREAQRIAVECALANGTRLFSLEANPLAEFTVILETNAGHRQPSGSAQDRRLWLEFVAYDDAGQIVFSSGNIVDGELEEKPEGDPKRDPNLWLFRDHIYDASGKEVHMFWEAEPSAQYPNGYFGNSLPARTDAAISQGHTVERTYRIPSLQLPARVTARLRMRPMGMDVLRSLVDSGDLDPTVVAAMPTFTLYGSSVEWRREDGLKPITVPKPPPLRCPDDYLCLLEPDLPSCR